MGEKICLIRQPAGLGDIFFCQKIKKHFEDLGYKIIWPVIDEFLWLNEYLEGYYPSINSDFQFKEYYHGGNIINNDELFFLPLQDADRMVSGFKIMESKYKLISLDYHDWSNYFNYNRNNSKEEELYYNVLNLTDESEYTLISNNYGSPPNFKKFPIANGESNIVYLDFIEDFTLFDWIKVIENANKIKMIDSSLNYILETLTLNAEQVSLYTRRPNNFSEIDYLFNNVNYNFIY